MAWRMSVIASVVLMLLATSTSATTAAPRRALPFDFNGDGRADLAVGAPGADVVMDSLGGPGGAVRQGAGKVHIVLRGGEGVPGESYAVSEETIGYITFAESGDAFGSSLDSGDFNADGFADLAVSAPGHEGNGAVYVLYFGRGGVVDAAPFFSGDDHMTGNGGLRLGAALAVADFNGDGYDDVAMGAPGAAVSGRQGAGDVRVYFGGRDGISRTASGEHWHQDSPGIHEEAGGPPVGLDAHDDGTWERFGAALAAGDLNGDGFDDLAVGVPGEGVGGVEGVGTKEGAGAVHALFGSASGLTSEGNLLFHLDTAGVKGVAESRDGEAYDNQRVGRFGDRFGATLALGDFDGDGHLDLAVGAPDKQVVKDAPQVEFHGSVSVLYGSPWGPTTRDQYFTEQTRGVPGKARDDWQFSASLAAGDFNRDGRDDLAISAVSTLYREAPAGSVNVLYGARGGLTTVNARRFTQDTPGVPGRSKGGDQFGNSLRAVDAIGGTATDLVIGVPGKDIGDATNAGALVILKGRGRPMTGEAAYRFSANHAALEGAAQFGDGFGSLTGTMRRLGLQNQTE